ncbi:MAG: CHAT domain-containing protein [Nocardioidaceae bacterium]|nr:CHAT domain-containing protein [Nocardioidaceae bacterium]
MRSISYLDFDVLVERTGAPGRYRARVTNAPSGETAPIDFTSPFSELELENFLLKIGRPRQQGLRGIDSPETSVVKSFGIRLFDSIFTGDLRLALARSVDQAESQEAGLRLRLRLNDCPELADLPWEYLYDKTARRYLALSEWTPVVRYLDMPGRVRPLTIQGPLRILALVSSPSNYSRLDVDQEWSKLRDALHGLESAGQVEIRRVLDGSLAALQRELRRNDYHVFHYIGHGGYQPGAGDGVLILEDDDKRGLEVSGQDLGVLLHDHRTLRLAVLNSCEGARGGLADPYSGTAQTLVQQGIAAVVAMQFEISDEAAITFAHVLYEAIADGYPLDASMAEARKAIRNQPNATEWGTPVLYLRAPDGKIFDIANTSPDTVQHDEPASAAYEAARTAEENGDLDSAIRGYAEALRIRPDHAEARARGKDCEHQKLINGLVEELRRHIELGDWGSAVAVADALEAADADASDPDGLATTAREALNRQRAHPADRGTIPTERTSEERNRGMSDENLTQPRPRGIYLLVAAIGALLAGTAVVVALAIRNDGSSSAGSVPAPFESATLYEFARQHFDAAECKIPGPGEAPVAEKLPLTELVRCYGRDAPYTGTFWCADDVESFESNREVFVRTAADGSQQPVTGPPAGRDEPVDGIQVAFNRVGSNNARVYWDSPALLCAGELQAGDDIVDRAIGFWRNGKAS